MDILYYDLRSETFCQYILCFGSSKTYVAEPGVKHSVSTYFALVQVRLMLLNLELYLYSMNRDHTLIFFPIFISLINSGCKAEDSQLLTY